MKKTKKQETPEILAALNAPIDVLPPPDARDASLADRIRGRCGVVLPDQSSTKRHHGRGGDSDRPSTPVSPHHRPVLPRSRMGTLVPRCCGEFHYERCGCLVFIPTPHLDVMLRELKDHLHSALKRQWESLRCECGLRPRMKLSFMRKDLSDLRGESARRGGVWQSPLSVFPVDPLETARPERPAAARAGVTGKGEAVEGRVRGRRELQHHPVPRRIPKFGFSSAPQVRVRKHESFSRMENRDVHGSLDAVPER